MYKSDYVYHFPIDLKPVWIPIGSNSTGKWLIQSNFSWFTKNHKSICVCVFADIWQGGLAYIISRTLGVAVCVWASVASEVIFSNTVWLDEWFLALPKYCGYWQVTFVVLGVNKLSLKFCWTVCLYVRNNENYDILTWNS